MYRVLLETKDFIAIDKTVVMPCIRIGDSSGLSDEVMLEFPEISGLEDYGFTHRLDNETMGVLIIARNIEFYTAMRDLFNNKEVHKKYHARVCGSISPEKGSVDYPIAHCAKSKKKMIAVKAGYRVYRGEPRYALTEWDTLEKHNCTSDLELTTNSGVRHQIRVHLASIGYAICGDSLYAKNELTDYPSLMLICKEVQFECPLTKKIFKIISTINLNNMFNEL